MSRVLYFFLYNLCLCWLLFFNGVVVASTSTTASARYTFSPSESSPGTVAGTLNLVPGTSGPYGGDIKELSLLGEYLDDNTFRLRIRDKNNQRYEVPWIVNVPEPQGMPDNLQYNVSFVNDPFSFRLMRLNDETVLFDSSSMPFVYSDQYLSIGNSALGDNPNIYGFGERVHAFRLDPNNKTYTMFNKDNGNTPDINLYGTHPFYLQFRDGKFYGVFMYNSNAMDAVLDNSRLEYRMIGGIIDLFIFSGPTADDVLRQYHAIIGKPYLPPYWSLGWHQCRWGYQDINETRQVVEQYEAHSLPLEVMWNDIDYMDEYKDFTFSPNRFPIHEMRKFVQELHESGRRYVVIVDPGIKPEIGYKPFDQGRAQDVFIKLSDGTPVVNKVWPGFTVFPDFTSEKGVRYWYEQIQRFHTEVPVDGLWIDMNEIVGFCNGECHDAPPLPPMDSILQSQDNNNNDNNKGKDETYTFDPDHPPYIPGNVPLDTRTINMSCILDYSINYNVHNLYGITETNATRLALEKVRGKRALVISRSTFAGQGHVGAHWLGDNESTWSSMYYSIPGILSMNLFGIPFVGADICGFNGNTTRELCTRWIQLGAFYPFSRNHNSINQISQEPYAFGPDTTAVARRALRTRYALVPYYYSLFFHVHRFGGSVVKPMFFDFPDDRESSLPLMDRQFLVGSALLVAPVLTEGATSKSVYLPGSVQWFSLWSGEGVPSSGWVDVPAPLNGEAPVFVRSGSVVPMHAAPGLTLRETRKHPMHVLVALDTQNQAYGELYVDEGEELDVVTSGKYSHFGFSASVKQGISYLAVNTIHNGFHGNYEEVNMSMAEVRVLGVRSPVCKVLVDGKAIETWSYDPQLQILDITSLHVNLLKLEYVAWASC